MAAGSAAVSAVEYTGDYVPESPVWTGVDPEEWQEERDLLRQITRGGTLTAEPEVSDEHSLFLHAADMTRYIGEIEHEEEQERLISLREVSVMIAYHSSFYAVATLIFSVGFVGLGALFAWSIATQQLANYRPTFFIASLCCLGWLATSIAGILSWRR